MTTLTQGQPQHPDQPPTEPPAGSPIRVGCTIRQRLLGGSGTLLGALVLAACAASGQGGTAPTTDSSPNAGTSQTAADPVSVQNCGRTITLDAPAERIVSGWTTSSEAVLELGQGDRLVGQYNTSSGTPTAQYAEALSAVPVLSQTALTREQLAAAHPDLVLADGTYLFDGTQLPTIDQLAAQGTQVLVLSGFCSDDATGATVQDAFADVSNIATLTGARSQGQALTSQLRQRLQAANDRVQGQPKTPLVFLANYEGTLYTYDGVYTDIAAAAGGQNLYAGALPAGQYYSEVSREDVLAKDPSTIVLLTGADVTDAASAQAARDDLAQLLPGVRAVREGRVVTMPESDSTNMRAIDGVEELSMVLHP